MKKFVMVIVFMLTSIKYNFVFANNNSLYNFLQYKLSGETTFNIHTTSQRNTQNVLYSVDLKFIKLLTENNKIVLCINTGSSLDNFFNTVNSKNEYLHVKISKLFYETILFSDKLTITVGKIGFFSFFANNIYTGNTNKQFINEAFVKDKSIDIPKGTYALRLNYIYSKNFYVDLGCYAAENNVSLKGLKIIQITYNPYDAHYRLYYWVNDKKTQDLTSHGLGMSIDKLIFSKLGLFLRCSYKYPFTTIYLLNKHEKIPLFFLYSCGVQFTAFRSRLNDVIGFAIGQSYNHIEYSLYNTNKNKSLLLETQIETYYNYQLNNYVTISPTIQLIRNQHRENPHKRLFVYGIKINIVLF